MCVSVVSVSGCSCHFHALTHARSYSNVMHCVILRLPSVCTLCVCFLVDFCTARGTFFFMNVTRAQHQTPPPSTRPPRPRSAPPSRPPLLSPPPLLDVVTSKHRRGGRHDRHRLGGAPISVARDADTVISAPPAGDEAAVHRGPLPLPRPVQRRGGACGRQLRSCRGG